MQTVLLSIHLIVALALVVTILLQRSEGGALGMGGGGAGGMMTARGAGDLLTKATKWLAIVFLSNSLALGWLAGQKTGELDAVVQEEPVVQQEVDGNKIPELPSLPEG
ncbi:MAG: preprotein translocase subunit SecG [Kordiimonadaceae bacterium]|nr:preprotein translocase subunit SecG [Kordiimonadaceae bacterium]